MATTLLDGSTATSSLDLLPGDFSSAPGNPMEDILQADWQDTQHRQRERLETWQRASLQTIDQAILDPARSKAKPPAYAPDPASATRLGIVRSYLEVQNSKLPPEDRLDLAVPGATDLLRDRLADQLFAGKGKGDSHAFYTALESQAATTRDRRALLAELDSRARIAALDTAAGRPGATFAAVLPELRALPGYTPGQDPDLLAAWTETTAEARARTAHFAPDLLATWQAIEKGEDPAPAALAEITADPEDREAFLESIAALVRRAPKEQQHTVLSNLRKTTGRMLARLADSTAAGFGGDDDDMPAEYLQLAADLDPQRARARYWSDQKAAADFLGDLQDLVETGYDPVKPFAREGTVLGALERGLYAAPGAAATTLTALVPGYGPVVSYDMLAKGNYRTMRAEFMHRGLDREQASDLAGQISGPTALLQAPLERLGALAVVNKLPGLRQGIERLTGTLATRYLARAAGGAAIETATELGQDLLPYAVADYAETLSATGQFPDTVWENGKDGVFDGYAMKSLETFAAVAPLSILMAGGASLRDARVREFASASDTHILATGIQPDDLAALRNARGIAAQDRFLQDAWAKRDPLSDSAKSATDQLIAEHRAAIDAQRSAELNGTAPAVVASAEGFTLYDPATGEELGRAADPEAATRLYFAAQADRSEASADEIAYLSSLFAGSRATLASDTAGERTRVEIRPEVLTQTEAAARDPRSEARLFQQLKDEQALGRDPHGVGGIVAGEHLVEFRQDLRQMTNRIYEGSAGLLTVFHEDGHKLLKRAQERGLLQRPELLTFFSALDSVLGDRRAKDGTPLRFLPADPATVTDERLEEAVAELMESEILRQRKTGGRYALAPAILTKNLAALVRRAEGATLTLKAFVDAFRRFFGLALGRAHELKKAIKSGRITEAELDAFHAKLSGLSEQDQIQREADRFTEELLGPDAAPVPEDAIPFSLGRATVTPSPETQVYPGKEGSPTVIGPAAFSIRAFHGTPHKVDKFTTERIGTGEGAQAFGWGLYFAAERAVAEIYRKNLATKPPDVSASKDPAGWVAVQLFAGISESDISEGLQILELPPESLAAGKERFAEHSAKGNTYTVTLKPSPDDLLDWDQPLADQAPELLARLLADQGIKDRLRLRLASVSEGEIDSLDEALEFFNGAFLYDLLAETREILDEDALGGVQRSKTGNRQAAETLAAAGIRGIKFLDGSSRGQGEGTHNYVIFSDADIEILEENGQPVTPSFSLSSSKLADRLRSDAASRIADPARRAQAMARIARAMEDARLELERLELLAGGKRLGRSLRKEAAIREALRLQELENETWARHAALLTDDDLVKIRSQPGHAFLADPHNSLKGRLLSKAAAARKHPDLFARNPTPAEYEGSENVSRTLFGGTLAPDQAAAEMHAAGLIREPAPAAMWALLEGEARHVAGMKKLLEDAREELRENRRQAKDETNLWLREAQKVQTATFNPADEIRRTLALLDGILKAVPAEIRGRVGGYTQLAGIATNETRLAFLRDRLARVDKELTAWLRDTYSREFIALLDRARPEKDQPGQKPRGKIGASIHDLFAVLREAMLWTPGETEAHAAALEALVASGELTPEQESHATLEANLVRLAGDWGKADAARREAALLEAQRVYDGAYLAHKAETMRRREKRFQWREALQKATGKSGSRPERKSRAKKDQTTKPGRAKASLVSLYSWEQSLRLAFGEESPEALFLADWERRASNAKTDSIQDKLDQLDDLFASLAGGRFKGEQLRAKMAEPDAIKVGEDTFSELEAITATLMWRQEDGRRHMLGHQDDSGNFTGDWHFDEAFMEQLEAQLSPQAKALRLHLGEQYAAEYDRLNAVYRDLYGVNLPRHQHYSPLTVAPQQAAAGQIIDPVTGFATTQGFTPGSLKTRSTTAIAEPQFRDALQTYIAHARQMEHWIAYAPFTTEAMALLQARDLRNAVEAKAGQGSVQTLSDWLDYFALGGTRSAEAHQPINLWLSTKLNRAARAALIGRVSVLAIQATQLGAALAEMPAAAYLTRFAKLLTGRLDWSGALDSDFIQRRKAQMPALVQQAMDGLRAGTPTRLKFAARKLGETISGADALFTAGTYAITLDYHRAQAAALGLTGAEAEAHARQAAERATERVAQPVRPGTRSLVELEATGPSQRILWAFASEARQKFALTAFAFQQGLTPAQKARALAVTWLIGGAVATLVRAVMRDLRDDGEDDEFFDSRNWDPKRLALQAATGPLQGMPYVGSSIEGLLFKVFAEHRQSGNLLSATDGVATLTNLPDYLEGDVTLDEAIRDADTIMQGLAPASDTAAAASPFLHLLRDAFGIGQNLAD